MQCAAFAQTGDVTTEPVESISPSLLNSEQVEEEAATKAAPPAAKATTTALEPSDMMQEMPAALLQGLKKVSAETSSFEARIDKEVLFGNLVITVKKCVKSTTQDQPEDAALILIQDHKPEEQAVTVFSGWMFSSSPAISALEHPVYDITLLGCVGP